ncbi:MAG: methyltransferase domain-containing protein [Myxococcota bacterium]
MSGERPRFDAYSYAAVASVYDEIAAFYSLGRIARSKAAGIDAFAPGERVLFAGVGGGADAVEAARRGIRVTAIDLAPAMLARFERRLAGAGLAAETILGDVALHRPATAYDGVDASYFLNLWDAPRARAMLVHLASLVRPGGRIVLADFARPRGGRVCRAIAEAYYRAVDWIAWALGLCELHPILDYHALAAEAGLRIVREHRFPVLLGSDPAFVTIVAERVPACAIAERAARQDAGVVSAASASVGATGSAGSVGAPGAPVVGGPDSSWARASFTLRIRSSSIALPSEGATRASR